MRDSYLRLLYLLNDLILEILLLPGGPNDQWSISVSGEQKESYRSSEDEGDTGKKVCRVEVWEVGYKVDWTKENGGTWEVVELDSVWAWEIGYEVDWERENGGTWEVVELDPVWIGNEVDWERENGETWEVVEGWVTRVIGIGTTSCSLSKLDWATWVTESSSLVQLSRKFSAVTLVVASLDGREKGPTGFKSSLCLQLQR